MFSEGPGNAPHPAHEGPPTPMPSWSPYHLPSDLRVSLYHQLAQGGALKWYGAEILGMWCPEGEWEQSSLQWPYRWRVEAGRPCR